LNEDIKRYPNSAAAYWNRGWNSTQQKQYEKALEDFNKVLELKMDHPGLYLDRGYNYRRMHEYEKALNDFQKALEYPDEKADAHGNMAKLFQEQGNFREALAHWEEAHRLDTQNGERANEVA
jgi:tetratricopeptide (TPR) repeat protein